MTQVGSEVNLATGLLSAGALTSSPAILALLDERFTAAARRVEKQLDALPSGSKFEPLKQEVRGLLKLADFRSGSGEAAAERLQKVLRLHDALDRMLASLIDDINVDATAQGDEAVKRTSKMVQDLVAVQITDRYELELPALGRLVLRDAETGEVIEINTGDARRRDAFALRQAKALNETARLFRSAGIDSIQLRTDQPYGVELAKFFETREKRRRHG